MFRVTGLKILGRVDTHIFIYLFFSGKDSKGRDKEMRV